MAIYIREKEIQQREIDDGLDVKINFLRRNAAQAPIAVDWTCFGTPWDIENTLTVLYTAYSHIDWLFIVVPKPPSPSSSPELDHFDGAGRPCRIFKPAPDLQNLVYQCQDVHWSYVKDRIYQVLLGKDDSTRNEDDEFGDMDFWTNLYTTIMMASGVEACHHGRGEVSYRNNGGKSIRCMLPRISVQELSGSPEDIAELMPVPSLTRGHQLRLQNEATAAANAVGGVLYAKETGKLLGENCSATLVARDGDYKETTDEDGEINANNGNEEEDDEDEDDEDGDYADEDDEYSNVGAEKEKSVCQQQQVQASVSQYLPNVHCGNTVIWN
ncbi:P-loop containing nucleoside triphosphate hydrolase protein [Apiospora arundinis]